MRTISGRVGLRLAVLALALALSSGCGGGDDDGGSPGALRLSLMHSNDGRSQVINAGGALGDFGGAARFATLIDRLRAGEVAAGRSVLTLSAGDNFLAGADFNASLQDGVFYDAVAARAIRYDAIGLGNSDFDFGPDLLADFIAASSASVPHLAANLDVSAEPSLARLAEKGRIARSTVRTRQGVRIGIVGAITPALRSLSSPRDVVAGADVAAAVQGEIDRLTAEGVSIVILVSHQQGIEEERALVHALRGVDVAVTGGGGEVLANAGDVLLPGDDEVIEGPYPVIGADADGRSVPIVTTSGGYRYVGRLLVDFDEGGEVTAIGADSGPIRVAGGTAPDAVAPDPAVQRQVVEPVQRSIDALASRVVATSEVALDGRTASVRGKETNLGDLVADALLWQAQLLAGPFGAPVPVVALQNGGGIRTDAVVPPGDFTELDTFDALPFASFLAIVHDVEPAQLAQILENAVSQIEARSGRFAQVAGLHFSYDPEGTAQVLDADLNVVTQGSRLRDVTLDDGTAIVIDGEPVAGAPTIAVATLTFLANGGDQYAFGAAPTTHLGFSYQQALRNYLTNALEGRIPAALYPEQASGRIQVVTGTSNLAK